MLTKRCKRIDEVRYHVDVKLVGENKIEYNNLILNGSETIYIHIYACMHAYIQTNICQKKNDKANGAKYKQFVSLVDPQEFLCYSYNFFVNL